MDHLRPKRSIKLTTKFEQYKKNESEKQQKTAKNRLGTNMTPNFNTHGGLPAPISSATKPSDAFLQTSSSDEVENPNTGMI